MRRKIILTEFTDVQCTYVYCFFLGSFSTLAMVWMGKL
jgi:hypothetical protein